MNDMSLIPQTLMQQEVRQIPDVLRHMIRNSQDAIQQAALEARKLDPTFLVTVARGSSDHCAHYLKYAFEIFQYDRQLQISIFVPFQNDSAEIYAKWSQLYMIVPHI